MFRLVRRGRLTAALALCLVGTAACGSADKSGSGPQNEEKVVVFAGYGGETEKAMYKAWFDDFTKETGIKVVTDSPSDFAKLSEMVKSGNVSWDVVQSSAAHGVKDNPVLTDIDCRVVACDDFTDGLTPVYPQAVPLLTYSNVLAYNAKAFPKGKEPRGVVDFFDPKGYPGKRVTLTAKYGWTGQFVSALVAVGTPRDQLYPVDFDKAFDVMEKIRSLMIVPSSDQDCITNVGSGEASMGLCYGGRSVLAADGGMPIEVAWGQQVVDADYVMIPKNAPHPQNAQRLVAYITSKEHNAALAGFVGFGPTNPLAKLDPNATYAASVPAAHILKGDLAPIPRNNEYWTNERQREAVEKVSAWLQK